MAESNFPATRGAAMTEPDAPRGRDYAVDRDSAALLAGAIGLPISFRRMVIGSVLRDKGAAAVVDLFAQFLGLAESVVENNRIAIEERLIDAGGMTARDAARANLPSLIGALLGSRLAECAPDAEWDEADLSAVAAYRRLWTAINGAGSWAENPWCMAVTFRVIPQNIDAIAP